MPGFIQHLHSGWRRNCSPALTQTTFCHEEMFYSNFPGGSYGKESDWNIGDPGSIRGPERPPGEGNGYPLQYSCLENSMHREAWWATVHRIKKGQTQLKQLSIHAHKHTRRDLPGGPVVTISLSSAGGVDSKLRSHMPSGQKAKT